MDQLDRDALEDHNLIEDDNTPDMRKAPAATEALQTEPPTSHHNLQEF
jgi:hypothetical protein